MEKTNCQGNGRTATVDFSSDSAAQNPTFNLLRLEERDTGSAGQDGPSIRAAVAAASDGTVYVAYFGWRDVAPDPWFSIPIITADVVVARDDAGGVSAQPFRALTDPTGGPAGKIVAAGRRIVRDEIAQERYGSSLSLAVDPTNSSIVYIAWADDMPSHSLRVRRSTDRGLTWSDDIRTVLLATNPSLAINSSGVVGLLYQQVKGTGWDRWVTHFERTSDGFQTVSDMILANTSSETPVRQFDPYIGDYTHLMTVGQTFYGSFAASNYPDKANFPQNVSYNRLVDWDNHELFNVIQVSTGPGKLQKLIYPVAPSIDPFFFSVEERFLIDPCLRNLLICHGVLKWPVDIWGPLRGSVFVAPMPIDPEVDAKLRETRFPAYLELFLDGLPADWNAGLFDSERNSIHTVQHRTSTGIVITLRLNNREEAQGLEATLIAMQMGPKAVLRTQHHVTARLLLSDRPYIPGQPGKVR